MSGAATDHQAISSLTDRTYVEGVYSLMNPQLGTTRTNKPFLKCILRDATGEMPARMWTFEEAQYQDLVDVGFVHVRGNVQFYQGVAQLILETIERAEVTPDQIRSLLPCTKKDIDEMFARVLEIMRSLTHPAMRELAEQYLTDERLMTDFRQAPAAVQVHHAWIGGLLEHTLNLLELAERALPLYPGLNRDLVLMGLFLHDLAKTIEMEWARGFTSTDEGQLVGHIVRGAIWLQVKAAHAAKRSGISLPGDTLRVLQHILLSHHGQLEHGAAKLPATPEAIFVSQLDNLDARMGIVMQAARRDVVSGTGGGMWTERVWAIDTKVYRPDPLA
ncbi:MAG: HD domain-containing protein [Planctomycetota bacterium]|jgi:3'-5' exoribonuclease|nr:MAG: HD domain-containing protein [Planctomycetota bacterium]RLS96638.1 MAG: HD domain-containing protein [Planctomycetota bacterium]